MAVWADAQREQHHEKAQCPLCRSLWISAPSCKPLIQFAASDTLAGIGACDEVELPIVPLISFDTMRFARPWAQLFGDRLVSCFLSPDWSIRQAALCKLGLVINETIGHDASAHLPVVMGMLERACADPVLKVYGTALHIIISLQPPHDHSALVPIIDRILSKCGDANAPTRYENINARRA